jgi:hypothetical protein
MTLEEFRKTLNQSLPPEGIGPLLQAMWFDGKEDWDKAHDIAQEIHTKDGSWIHAYLHRKEGDEGNAGYWYARAGKPFFRKSLREEWDELVMDFLKR